MDRIAHFFSRTGALFMLALPMALTEAALGSDYPGNSKASESIVNIEELDIPDSHKTAILGKNSERIVEM